MPKTRRRTQVAPRQARRTSWYRVRNSRSRSSRLMRRRASFRQFRCCRRRAPQLPARPPASRLRRPPPRRCLRPRQRSPRQAPAAPLAGSGEPKKIHTVTIRSDQVGNPSAAAPAPAPAAPAPATRPKSTEAPARPAAPKAGGNAPLAIVPVAQGAAPAAEPPPRSHVARTEAPSAPVATAPGAGGRRLCGPGHIATQRVRGPDRVQIAPGQIPRPAWQPAADHPSRRSRRQRHLLSRAGRSLRLLGGGRRHVQQIEGRRRQLHRPEELAAPRLTLVFGAG